MEAISVLTPVIALEDQTVIKNLETAFEEETRTQAACKAYAVKADEEGLHGLASLFRATARAEQIHASNHARVLRHLGREALADIHEPHIEATLENLKSALVDQKFEIDYLYPTFLTTAVSLFDSTAIRSFHWALEADKSHARLYSDAVARINASGKTGWASARHDFFICALCGYTAENPEAENCPACNYLWEKFETIR